MKKTGKVIGVGKNEQYYRIGETYENSQGFVVTPESKVDSSIQKRDTVEVEYDVGNKGEYNITSLTKLASAVPTGKLLSPTEYQRPKTPEETLGIRSQAIGKMVAQTISVLQGQVDPNNIHQIIKELYKTYDELIK